MKIIIIGAGKLGYTLAKQLCGAGNDITIIDNNPKALVKIEDTLDVLTIKGTGISTLTLLEAGCSEADLLIAVTGSDEINMLCCLTSKKLGVLRTIARIRDPQYAKELFFIKDDLGLDMVINPEQTTAHEIARLLTIPGITKFSNFAKGRVNMVELTVTDTMPIAHLKIKQIASRFGLPILIGAVIRAGQVIIPKGDFIILPQDAIYALGHSASIYNFCKKATGKSNKLKTVMVVGGGRITYYLVQLLLEMNMNIKIIEKDEEVCALLSEELPGALLINGDGTDNTLLEAEHLDAVDSFIALTGRDEENIISSLIATHHNVEKVITKVSRLDCPTVINQLGIDTIISPQDVMTNHILKYVRGNAMESLHRIMDGQGEVIEFIATEEDTLVGIPLSKLPLVDDVLIATIVRRNEVVIPNGNDMINVGDRVLIITTHNINGLQDIIGQAQGGLASELKNNLKKLGNVIGV
jgi:trk system potassium uptake protein TrkA